MSVKSKAAAYFDPNTNTISYVAKDPHSPSCAVIDSMDIDYVAGRITHTSANMIIDFIRTNELKVEWVIETHAHADHLSAPPAFSRSWAANSA
jgi:glyoxylase-like metal-dependent hydrolase (beta-lactamase superfamily II)